MEIGHREMVLWAQHNLRGYPAVAALSLNFKQGREFPDGWSRITPEIATRQTGWLLKNLDRKIFGNCFKRRRRKSVRLMVQELGNSDQRLHVHGAIGIPTTIISPVEFLSEIGSLWEKANWGYGHGKVDLCDIPNKWISYILKNGPSAVDDANTWLPEQLP